MSKPFLPGQMVRVCRNPDDNLEGEYMMIEALPMAYRVKTPNTVYDHLIDKSRVTAVAGPEDIASAKSDLVEGVARLMGAVAELEGITMQLSQDKALYEPTKKQVDECNQALTIVLLNIEYLKIEGAIK